MTPTDQARRLYEEAETQAAQATEQLVSSQGFGGLLAFMTENVVALTRVGSDMFDLGLRNLRLAGRQDVARLGRQIGRTEDKLEMVLQEVERLALGHVGIGIENLNFRYDAGALQRKRRIGTNAAAAANDGNFHPS